MYHHRYDTIKLCPWGRTPVLFNTTDYYYYYYWGSEGLKLLFLSLTRTIIWSTVVVAGRNCNASVIYMYVPTSFLSRVLMASERASEQIRCTTDVLFPSPIPILIVLFAGYHHIHSMWNRRYWILIIPDSSALWTSISAVADC